MLDMNILYVKSKVIHVRRLYDTNVQKVCSLYIY